MVNKAQLFGETNKDDCKHNSFESKFRQFITLAFRTKKLKLSSLNCDSSN